MKNRKILVTGGALLERLVGEHDVDAVMHFAAHTIVPGWTPRFDDLDTIVQTSLAWEKKIASADPSAYRAD